jgi:t-SNARE complex subunit (syntaxin)
MMDDNPLFDPGQRAAHDPQRFLYAGAKNELQDLKKAIAEENLAVAAGEKARGQRIIGIVIFLVILALFAIYAIFQILGQ